MNHRTAVELALDRYLADRGERLPDRVLEETLTAIDHTPQRRRAGLPWRLQPVSNPLKAALAAVVLMAVVVAGSLLLQRQTTLPVAASPSPSTLASPSPAASAPPSSTPSPRATSVPSPTPSLPGSAFAAGPLAAGTYHSTAFTPYVVATLPDGWARAGEDRELLRLKRGNAELGFAHNAAAVAPADAHGTNRGDPNAPTPVTLGAFSGFETSTTETEGTLYIDEGLRAYDAPPGTSLHTWVLDVDGRVLTILLTAPTAEIDAALDDARAVLETLARPD